MKPYVTVGEAELLHARDDLVEHLMDGKKVDGVSFADIIDCHLDAHRVSATQDVAGHFLNMADESMDEHTRLERTIALKRWVRALVELWIDGKPDLIRQHAFELVAAEQEAA